MVCFILKGYTLGGSWTPKISFSSTNDNPSIRIYRATGTDDCNGHIEKNVSYPWWIENNADWQTNGVYGGLFFKTGDAQCSDGNESVTTKVSFLRNGNVGIGVVNPHQKLVVDGMICAEEVRVSLSGSPCWSDFVFNKDYKLRTLTELEKYIKEKGHLPEIPTSDEVVQNGIELGDMQAKLLQKIEELTLYVIDLKKENEEIKKKLEQMR